MASAIWFSSLLLACGFAFAGDEDTPVFRSDVAMGRIDTLVLDRTQHPVGGLKKGDFVLRQDGKSIPIRNLAYEDLPVDVLLLLDVSGSMRPHVEKVATAAHGALSVLGDQDRVGIMIFDSHARLRLPFKQDLNEVERKLDDLVENERFNGGTNICGALLSAAAYVEKEGRRQTRRAIVIVTDDIAAHCDQDGMVAALDRADAVLMTLLAPQFIGLGGGYPAPGGQTGGGRQSYPPVITPWPGSGGPLGGIILGRRRTQPAPTSTTVGFPGTKAGSPEIARASGGDWLNIRDASAVEDTFERIRRRYAIYFYLPDGMTQERGMELDLTNAARRRHPDAALQYRQIALAKDGARPGLITRIPAHPPSARDPKSETVAVNAEAINVESGDPSDLPVRRRGVNDSSGGTRVSFPVEQPKAEEDAPAPVINRRRGVSDPGSVSRATIGPINR